MSIWDPRPEIEIDEVSVGRIAAEAQHEAVSAALDAAVDVWETRARKDTGRMSESHFQVIAETGSGIEGVAEFSTEFSDPRGVNYSPYQEYGTRYIEGMHLTEDMRRAAIEAATRVAGGH